MIMYLIRKQISKIKNTKRLANEKNAHPWHASVVDALYLTIGIVVVGSFYTWVALDNFEQSLAYVPSWMPLVWQISDYLPFVYLGTILLFFIDKLIIMFIYIHSFILKKLMILIQKVDIWYWRRTGKEAVVTNAMWKLTGKYRSMDTKQRKMFDYMLYCGLLVFMAVRFLT